jgi:hypothetical protein
MERVILFFIFLLKVAVCFGQTAKEIYDENLPSTVNIRCSKSSGSGFFIGANLVATNFHVVDDCANAKIKLPNGQVYDIMGFVAANREADLAIIKVAYSSGKPVKFAVNDVSVGDRIFVIGNPQSMEFTLSDGLVSAKRNLKEIKQLQMSAPVSHGSSGGPVFNQNGELTGVSVSSLKEGQNINFAVHVDHLRELISTIGPLRTLDQITRSQEQSEMPGSDPVVKGPSVEEFKAKALQKAQDFGLYIKIVADKNSDWQEANDAINNACKLFINENAQVEVSSLGRQEKSRFKIRDYLNRIKLLQYDNIEVEWLDVHYVSHLRAAPDGNYYGIISISQKFSGKKDGKVFYRDQTIKHIEVVLKQVSSLKDSSVYWDVFLSDIGVKVTK